MVGKTTKRVFINETTLVGAASTARVDYEIAADKVNCSNIWYSMSIEPENQDANAQGSWVLWRQNQDTSLVTPPIWDDGALNDRTYAEYIIAAGVWGATNQRPYNKTNTAGKTSRNIRQDGILALTVHQTGISAGNSSVRLMLMCNTTTL